MRKLVALLIMAACINVAAQEVAPYALVKQNACLTYALLRGEKKKLNFGVCYYKLAVNSVSTSADGSKTVVYRTDMLNKKKKITSLSGSVGTAGGFFNQLIIAPDGSYAMDQDMTYGYGGEMARGGYMFKMPAKLEVGQTLESSTVNQQYVMMNQKVSTSLAYNNVKVVREEDYVTPVGTFHCFVITYTMTGTMNEYGLNMDVTLWVAPEYGVICCKYISGGTPIFIELSEVEGM